MGGVGEVVRDKGHSVLISTLTIGGQWPVFCDPTNGCERVEIEWTLSPFFCDSQPNDWVLNAVANKLWTQSFVRLWDRRKVRALSCHF